MRHAVLGAGFLEFLACDHDGDGGLGDEIVGEGAEEDAVGEKKRDQPMATLGYVEADLTL